MTVTLIWYRRWLLACLLFVQKWVGQQLERTQGPQRVTPTIVAAYEDVAPVLLEVRRHMHNVAAAFPRITGEERRQKVVNILQERGMEHRRAGFAIEVVMQEWMP